MLPFLLASGKSQQTPSLQYAGTTTRKTRVSGLETHPSLAVSLHPEDKEMKMDEAMDSEKEDLLDRPSKCVTTAEMISKARVSSQLALRDSAKTTLHSSYFGSI